MYIQQDIHRYCNVKIILCYYNNKIVCNIPKVGMHGI
jgi:hypothetical protein